MSVKCRNIINVMEQLAPSCLTLKNDNTGLLIGDENSEIQTIMVSLDINGDVFDEAVSLGANLIITHHPIIYLPIKNINIKNFKGDIIYKLISKGINVYSAHTNLDISDMGINEFLAQKLCLNNITLLKATYDETSHMDKCKKYGIGRIGYLKDRITFRELCSTVKDILNIDSIDATGMMDKQISKIAICSGDGSDFILDAYEAGCDAYITGDIRYHDACDARDMGMALIDAGHFATENIYMPELFNFLNNEIKMKGYSVDVFLSKKNMNPFSKV